jgi:hypothetical protein
MIEIVMLWKSAAHRAAIWLHLAESDTGFSDRFEPQ